VLLYRQTAGTYQSKADWLSHNANVPSSPNFSRLDQLEAYRARDGKFTFKLLWPQKQGTNFNQWRQSTNPVESDAVEGYDAIEVNFEASGWGGLQRSAREEALLDGCIGNQMWFYAVGTSTDLWGGIPGPPPTGKRGRSEQRAELWVVAPAGAGNLAGGSGVASKDELRR
jgi:hypothetical protein